MSTDDESGWGSLTTGQRVAIVVVGAVIALNVALSAIDSMVGSDPGGPVSSSYGTDRDGLQGWSELASRNGHPVERLRTPLDESRLDAGSTMVVADPGPLDVGAREALADFVQRGGRLVVVGEGAGSVVGDLTGAEPGTQYEQGPWAAWIDVPELGGGRRFVGGDLLWADAGAALPVAGRPAGPAVLVADVGRGRLVAIADAGPLQNQDLDHADNAAIALGSLGPPPRPVVFVESVHGFEAEGAAAFPRSWRWGAAFLFAALLVGMWSAGSRFGPPEPRERALRPARLEHVEAVAATLDRVDPAPPDTVPHHDPPRGAP